VHRLGYRIDVGDPVYSSCEVLLLPNGRDAIREPPDQGVRDATRRVCSQQASHGHQHASQTDEQKRSHFSESGRYRRFQRTIE
jgi:hypothetical protein